MITSGLDFGTTNSVIGYNDGIESKLLTFSNGKKETRTVLFEDIENKKFIVGDQGIQFLIEGEDGRLLQSPKSFLNTKEEVMTILLGKPLRLSEIISIIIKDFKVKLENIVGSNIDSVLLCIY